MSSHSFPTRRSSDLHVGAIIALELGELDTLGTLELFAFLIRSGLAYSLQGSTYGRTASALIDAGLITHNGEITEAGRNLDD